MQHALLEAKSLLDGANPLITPRKYINKQLKNREFDNGDSEFEARRCVAAQLE